jgi:hypothetical protein
MDVAGQWLPDRIRQQYFPDTTLAGTALVSRARPGVPRCDLATAATVRARSEAIPFTRGTPALYLDAWENDDSPAVSLLLYDGRRPAFAPDELRAIAAALEGRPWRPGRPEHDARALAATLHNMADLSDRSTRRREVPLNGRGHGKAVRVGTTVRRVPDRGSDFAADVLRYLNGPYPGRPRYPHAPYYLGTDEEGRDILSYINGTTTDHPCQRAEGAYRLGGKILRKLHDVTAGTSLAGQAECVTHGDPGPRNTIFSFGYPVALIGWSDCRPGPRLADLAHMAWTWCIQPDGSVPVSDQAAHLRELISGYGNGQPPASPADMLRAILRRQEEIIGTETARYRDNPAAPPPRREHADRVIAWASACYDLTLASGRQFLAALAG